MPGRHITQNIQKILDIVNYMDHAQEPGLLLSLDFYKCFDTLDHQSIAAAFRHYGFGPIFVEHLMLLFTELQSCVQNNSFISSWFPV